MRLPYRENLSMEGFTVWKPHWRHMVFTQGRLTRKSWRLERVTNNGAARLAREVNLHSGVSTLIAGNLQTFANCLEG